MDTKEEGKAPEKKPKAKAKPRKPVVAQPIFFDAAPPRSIKQSVTNLFEALPTRLLIFAIGTLVLIMYTVPLLFFAIFPSIKFFFHVYPLGLAGFAVYIFREAFKIKPRLGVEKATLILSVASVLVTIVYLFMSFSYVGTL